MKSPLSAVIPVAGLGTRMLPLTKALPKEMLPLPVLYKSRTVLVPLLHLIILKLHQSGVKRYIIVLSKEKEPIKNYLTTDYEYVRYLKEVEEKSFEAELLEKFYRLLDGVEITYVYQGEPRGFGDAVYHAREYIEDDFIIHPGDDFIIDTSSENYIDRLFNVRERYDADIAVYIEEVEDPRHYGVIRGYQIDIDIYYVEDLIEKPDKPPSNLAITAIYLTKKDILDEMDNLKTSGKKWELVDAVKNLLDKGYKAVAIKIDNQYRIDVGRPSEYIRSIEKTLKNPIII